MFKDRYDAGRQLAARLQEYKDSKDTIILAIPRGSLEIGYELGKELHLPLDVIFTKKISAPGIPEMAIGTVSMDKVVIAPEYSHEKWLTSYVDHHVKAIRELLAERIKKYRAVQPQLDIHNKTVILIDDGVATGQTMLLAIMLVKEHHPKKLIVALPVGPADTIEIIRKQVDQLICLQSVRTYFFGVGQFYHRFEQVEDDRAIELLKEANS